MARRATTRILLCLLALALAAGVGAQGAAASASKQRIKYLERRIEVAQTELGDAQAKVIARFEHRVAAKERRLQASGICPSSRSEARQAECHSRTAAVAEQAQQELALAREHRLGVPHIVRLEQRIARLQRELAAATAP
jgi:hypothetical protein